MTDLATFSCKSGYKVVRVTILRLKFSKIKVIDKAPWHTIEDI
jgi:hypothetical protein